MAISFHDASVALFIQTLGGVENYLTRAQANFDASGIDPKDILTARIHETMLPFRFQIYSTVHHSLGAVEAVKAGLFKPPVSVPELDYPGLLKLVADARQTLEAMAPAEVNALEDREVAFRLGERTMMFNGAGFLMTFSLPNLHFHATTAYDILRMQGAPLGKRDYMGRMKMRA